MKRFRWLFWIFAGAILCSFAIFRFASVVDAKEPPKDLEDLKVFADVLSIVQRDYVREVKTEELIKGAIKGMLSTLDPHSVYMDADVYKELQVETTGEFGGLGIEITLKDNLLIVVAPIEGSPAARAGIQSGDAIIKINGEFTKDLSLLDAVKKMRGPKGTPITISIMRKGNPDLIDVTIIRDVIHVRSVKSRYLKDGIGLVRISQFQEHTADELKKALRKLHKKSPKGLLKGLVLDLRNNPGGLLTEAIKVSDLFLKEGIIVYTDGRVEAQKKKFFAHPSGTEPGYPMVVLVNEGSASASEIVAGAFKDHGRALILGTNTFGKGSVQTVLPLENGGALRLTTALYYTKSGRSIQAKGVEPDIVMEPEKKKTKLVGKKSKIDRIREKDLPGAIRNPVDGESEKPSNNAPIPVELPKVKNIETMDLSELLKEDAQLRRAVNLLKTFNIFKVKEIKTKDAAKEAANSG